MGDADQHGDLAHIIDALIARCVKAETELAVERARARYWAGAARRAMKAKTLEKARALLETQHREDMGLLCILD